jgi:transposase InsO family protein
MKTKDKIFNRFQDFKSLVENQTSRKIKVLRSNNGGKYTSNDFDSFCRKARIKRELTIPYNLQQNGVGVRKNTSTVETTKSMVHDLYLPMFLWEKAYCTVLY